MRGRTEVTGMTDNIVSLASELMVGVRSLSRTKGVALAVIITLALGIGANAAMFSLVRGVLLRPLVNREEDRLVYIRQSTNSDKNTLFSVPDILDLTSRVKTLKSFGDFSTLGFTMTGLGEPRTVQAGVVGGSYFQVMGLRPVLGRLLDEHDDGPNAAGAVVLTYRFWSTVMNRDPSVIGKTVRLGSFIDTRSATVVGVLEPCLTYPQATEIIANIVTSAHHLSATMVTGRIHRMTELFVRLPPGGDLKTARTELYTVYDQIKREHPDAYPARLDYHISAVLLRDQLSSGARTILLVLMGAAILVFVIACSNVANLILARTMRREGELGIRAALGASTAALRRTLLIESLLLSAAGAALGMLIAGPMVSILGRYLSRYSLRAADLTLDSSMLWVGGGLAVLSAALLAFVPRLPSSGGAEGFSLVSGSARVTNGANRKLRAFAVVQIAASFVLVAAAGATVRTLLALEAAQSGLDTQHVLAINVPVMRDGKKPQQVVDYYREAARQIRQLPGVEEVSAPMSTPWRDNINTNFSFEISADGHVPASGEERHRAQYRVITPGYFVTLGRPILEGRDFTDGDRKDGEPVAIVSQSLAQELFPNGSALNHHVLLTDPILKFVPTQVASRRIVGIVADLDDVHLAPKPIMILYHPYDQDQIMGGGRLLVRSSSDPYGLVMPITRILRTLSANQPVERPATLADIRTEVIASDRLNVIVFSVFAGVALLIAVVGVAGVLAFSVSGRTREFGIRLAVGSQPSHLLIRVIFEGAGMTIGGLALGLACGYGLAQLAGTVVGDLKMPGMLPIVGSALVLLAAAVTASLIPAARAARVDVLDALRSE